MNTLEKFGAILGFSGIIATSAGCETENPAKPELENSAKPKLESPNQVIIFEKDSVGREIEKVRRCVEEVEHDGKGTFILRSKDSLGASKVETHHFASPEKMGIHWRPNSPNCVK